MPIIDIFYRGIAGGVELAVETLNETNMEVSIIAITKMLNQLKWMGKSNWTTLYVETYLDNLRGNSQARVMGRMMRSEVFKIQATNFKIVKRAKINSMLV